MSKKTPSTKTDKPVQSTEKTLVAPNSQVTVTIPWSKLKAAYDKVLAKVSLNVKTDGFRKGKVPPHLAANLVDNNKLYEQALQEVFPEIYLAEIQKTNKKPISQPDLEPIQTEKDQDWSFTVYFAERPEIKLGDYQKVIAAARANADKEISGKIAELITDKSETAKTKELTTSQKEDIKLKHIFRELAQAIEPQIPELLIREEVNRELHHLVDQLQQLNIKVEDYLKSRQIDGEQLRQEYAAMSLSTLQIEFIIAEIAKDQKMTITDAEIDATLDQVGEGKLSETDRQNPDTRSYIFSSLLKQKVIKNLLES